MFTLFNPCFALGVLTLGTMTVAAAVVTYADVSAGVAPVHVTAKGGSTATTDGMQRSENIPVELMLICKVTAKPFNDLCQFKSRPQPFW